MPGDMEKLKERLSHAREAQKAADTAIGLTEVLVKSLEGLGLPVFVDISGIDNPSARVVLGFSVQTGVILTGSGSAGGLVTESLSHSVELPVELPSNFAELIDPQKTEKPSRMARRWTESEVAQARRMRARRQTAREIAKVLGRPVDGVKSKLQEIGASAPAGQRKQAPRWSAKEIATAKRLLREGAGPKAISAAVGRPYAATSFKLRSLRKEVAKEDAGAAPARSSDPGPKVPPAGSSLGAAAGDASDGCLDPPTPLKEPSNTSCRQVETGQPVVGLLARRMIERRLDKLGYPDGWDTELDLEMVELIVGGTKAQDAAIILEMTKDQVVKRFHDLCPEPTIDKQAMLLGVLRRRAGKEEVA